MAAIGAIRKHGILLMCIIGIALLAFVMGDVSKLTDFFSDKYTMVKINGKKLDDDYRTRLEQMSSLWKIFYEKTSLDESDMTQIHDMSWNQLLEQNILEQQLKDLGLQITKEMKEEIAADMLASLQTQQPNQLLQRLVMFLTQQLSAEQAISLISNIEEYKNNPNIREVYNAYKAIERFALIDMQRARYMALANDVVKFSDEAAKFFAESNNAMLTQAVTFYPSGEKFNELTPTVTDKEIKDRYNNHKSRYKINENARDIDVAVFPIQPSPEDLERIQDTVMNRATRMKAAASIEEFNISMMQGQLDSTWFKRTDIQLDTLVKLIFDRPVGSFIEPLQYENSVWYYGQTYGIAKRPDSVQVARLIVDYRSDRNSGSDRTKEEAKNISDSLKNVLQKGGDIFALRYDYLGGTNAADSVFWVSEHSIYPQLYNAWLENNVYIDDQTTAFVVFQVLQRTTPIEKRQFAIYTEEIKPSDATVKSIRSQATQLQAECGSAEDLMTIAAQNGVQVMQGKDITSMMSSISQLQNAREIVSWSFNPNTKPNAVSDVYNINNSVFAVAAIRTMKSKGYSKLDDVRTAIETELTAMKKLEMVKEKITEELANASIKDVAENYGMFLMDSLTLTFGADPRQNRSIENTAIGKIFALPVATPTAITGKNNVYAVSIYEMKDAAEPSINFMMERSMLKNAVSAGGRNENIILEGLKEKTDILDQRYLYFAR